MNLFQVNVVVAVTNGRYCTQRGLGVIGVSHKVIGVFIIARTWRTVGTGRFYRGGTQVSNVEGERRCRGSEAMIVAMRLGGGNGDRGWLIKMASDAQSRRGIETDALKQDGGCPCTLRS